MTCQLQSVLQLNQHYAASHNAASVNTFNNSLRVLWSQRIIDNDWLGVEAKHELKC
jgi:hypothetical protein